MKNQAIRVPAKKLLSLSAFKKIQKPLIQPVVGMHIAFIIVQNLSFLVLLRTFSAMLVI